MALRVSNLWADLQRESEVELTVPSGSIAIGKPDSRAVVDARASHEGMDVTYDVLGPKQMLERFPMVHLDHDEIGIFDSATLIGFPERAVATNLRLAQEYGAVVRTNEAVHAWRPAGRLLEVDTADGIYAGNRLVLAAGGWTGDLLGGELTLTSERQVMAWFRPLDGAAGAFSPTNCPVLILSNRADYDYAYGIPDVLGDGVRFALHLGGTFTHADNIDRAVYPGDIQRLVDALAGRVVGLASNPFNATVCFYPHADDRVFCLGRHPRHQGVVIATGSSGHGFRWSPVIGEIVAELVDGDSSFDLTPFDVRRLWSRRPTKST